MKVVLSSMNFSPELTGIGKYSGETARGLVQRGHRVVAVCAPPYYPQWRVGSGFSSWLWRVERPEPGLTVIRCPLWVPRRPSGLKRLLHLLSFTLSSLPVMMLLTLWRPSLIFAVAPAFFCAPGALLAARLCGARAWLHVQDFELDAAFQLGMLRGQTIRRISGAFERLVMRRFDKVSTISRHMARQLAVRGVPRQRSELLPNWVDLEQIQPLPGSPALRRDLGIAPEQIVFLFSGSMNRKQGLAVLFAALDHLCDQPQIVLVLCGTGEMRDEVDRLAVGRSQVRVLGLQPPERLNGLLNMADVHLLPQLRGAADLVMPSKLSAMLASGRPVIAAAFEGTEMASVVEGRGIVVQPESAQGFADAMRRLAADGDERRTLGANARAHAELMLGCNALIGRLESALLHAVAGSTTAAPAESGGGGAASSAANAGAKP